MSQNTENPISLPAGTEAERIQKALAIIVTYGGFDGAHHKDWTLDQATRALTGCPVTETVVDTSRGPVTCFEQGESEEYRALVKAACGDDTGEEAYGWNVGSPP